MAEGMDGPCSGFLARTGSALYPESGTGAMMVEFGVMLTCSVYMAEQMTVRM
ncbi:MAG: hypothetical protein ACI8RZ_004733 [Myxococcota bacterium]|jgi:hypothetical protein